MSQKQGQFIGGLLREAFKKEKKNDPNNYEKAWVCKIPSKKVNNGITCVGLLVIGISIILFAKGMSDIQQNTDLSNPLAPLGASLGLVTVLIISGIVFLIGVILLIVGTVINSKCSKAIATKKEEENLNKKYQEK